MRVLKAYANAAQQTLAQRQSGNIINRETGGSGLPSSAAQKERKSSGDTLTLSDAARERLGHAENLSFCPQDATYDQNGYITRQVESVQGDLRSLAANLSSIPGGAMLSGQVKSMQNHLGMIQTQV